MSNATTTPQMRLRITIRGAVQGVGFRPFIYRLAISYHLTGQVSNDTHGVCIEVEGLQAVLEEFVQAIPVQKPPLAIIHSLEHEWLLPHGYTTFTICHSEQQGDKSVLVLPDIATCTECLHDIFDPANRRHRYPFTNCTNCGPRFSIIQALPYDRPNTTMAHFVMCPACQQEYESPEDRRFHAQPNACAMCGPALAYDSRAQNQPQMNTDERRCKDEHTSDAILAAAEALRTGSIVAVKGLGGFHLMVDATNADAVARLRERKPRRDKPLALMVRDLVLARTLCELTPQDEAALASPEAPILLLPRKATAPVAPNVAPESATFGIMLAYTPLHHLLLHEVGRPLVATSGNLSDEPICTDNQDAFERLGHIADCFLLHNRPIERHVDDSIAWVVGDTLRVLRRARGYAPLPVLVQHALPTILATGAQLKTTIALSGSPQQVRPDSAYTPVFISQHIGDLETLEATVAFERVIADFLRLYEASPVAIAHDMHPDYVSTRWAIEATGALSHTHAPPRLIAVQHHHAHLASCLVDNGIGDDIPALGVTWDGTGYGTDGTIWGGEFLLGTAASVTRIAHLRPFCLPGSEAAVREPRRIALALLWNVFGDAVMERDDLLPVQACSPTERRVVLHMMQHHINSPVTTSAGRLFDGIAALIGLHQQVSFEGQAAMALEYAAHHETACDAVYPFAIASSSSGTYHIDWRPLIEAIVSDLQHRLSPAIISMEVHNTLAQAIVAIARLAGEPRVALTGGCFQNRILTQQTTRHLTDAGFEVLLHRQVPPNDGGISLGQIVVAAAQMKWST